jgi:colanic acid/amylovoran biosynthesis protein
MNQVLLLGASFSTGNMGVGALAAGALTLVSERYPQAQVQLLDYGRSATASKVEVKGKSLQVPLINLRFSWKLLLPNNIATLLVLAVLSRAGGAGWRRWLMARNPWLKRIAQADVAVAVSGGDSFSDIYGLGRFFYVALPQFLALALGVKLIMLPQTLGPFRGKPARCMAGFLMRRAALVCSRDQAGMGVLSEFLNVADAKRKARFCFDMGFVLEPHVPAVLDLGGLELQTSPRLRPLVGLNISGLLWMGGYNRGNMFDLKLDYSALIDALIQHLINEQGATVLLIPHVFGSDAESDTLAVRAVQQRLAQRFAGRLFCVRGNYDQSEIKHVIGLCDFFVGSRMHACIAALSQGIPAVGVAYSDKFAGVFNSVGPACVVADPRELTLAQTVQVIAKAFGDRGAAKRQLQQSMPRIKTQVLALLDEVV